MNSETPAKIALKTLCRKRKDGEIILLFPEEPGDPEGQMAVGFVMAGGHMVFDTKTLIDNTAPATEKEAQRVIAVLKADPYNYEIEVIDKVLKEHWMLRRENRADYFKFERIRHLY